MNTTHPTGTELRRSIERLVTGTAIGLSALSIALAAPAAAKGPHPGPVIDRPEPTSSFSAQTNDGHTSTAPMTPTGRTAPGAIPRSQPAVSINAQQYTRGADDPGDTARRAEVRMPTMPGGLTPADAGRLFGGMAGASK